MPGAVRGRLLCLGLLPAAAMFLGWIHPASADGQDRFRRLAPGVETTIPPSLEPVETHSAHDVVEIHTHPGLQWTPHFTPGNQTLFDISAGARFQHSIWCLEFSFKPLRMIFVDIPQQSGKMQRKLVWYLVYRVQNRGERLAPSKAKDAELAVTKSDKPIQFQPHFVLESHEYGKAYLDRVIPAAIGLIQKREDPQRTLLSTVEMAEQEIPVSTERADRSVWGVATWEDVDPRIDFFSIYIQGLTNAYLWVDPPGAYKNGDPPGKGRHFTYKTLQLNFWRPGDSYREHEKEIRFGVPEGKADKFGVGEGVDHAWVYR